MIWSSRVRAELLLKLELLTADATNVRFHNA
jgi:hypothetical protein